jgi:pilus assembly protein Flp/PilA
MANSISALMIRVIARFQSEDGQALSEYGLILGLIAVVALAALTLLGTSIVAKLGLINAAIG